MVKISKWGGSLAVRLPKELVEAGGFREGDDVDLSSLKTAAGKVLTIEKRARFRRALVALAFESEQPVDFDRDEANERDPLIVKGDPT